MLFQNTRLDGEKVDLRTDNGVIRSVSPPGSLRLEPGESVRSGGMVTPHLSEPHVHLDAALLGAQKPNRSGTLVEGIANWAELRENLSLIHI